MSFGYALPQASSTSINHYVVGPVTCCISLAAYIAAHPLTMLCQQQHDYLSLTWWVRPGLYTLNNTASHALLTLVLLHVLPLCSATSTSNIDHSRGGCFHMLHFTRCLHCCTPIDYALPQASSMIIDHSRGGCAHICEPEHHPNLCAAHTAAHLLAMLFQKQHVYT
jgi:hypothetical protein